MCSSFLRDFKKKFNICITFSCNRLIAHENLKDFSVFVMDCEQFTSSNNVVYSFFLFLAFFLTTADRIAHCLASNFKAISESLPLEMLCLYHETPQVIT